MRVEVHLHTILQRPTPDGPLRTVSLQLGPGATIQDVLSALDIGLNTADLILAVNHRVVDRETLLADGDRLDIIPAISGG